MYDLFKNTIKRIGPQNIVQVVTNNASENVKAGSMMMGIYPHIYWTLCAAHCINLMLGDIFKINPYETGQDKICNAYLTFRAMYNQKKSLRMLILSTK